MKIIISIVLTIVLISCSSSKKNKINRELTETKYKKIKIYNNPLTNENSNNHKEIRFYEIKSAFDASKMMYINYGKWHERSMGVHQSNISQKIWYDIKLFEQEPSFTIITDGTETSKDFYTCITILDSKGLNCMENDYPLREKIIDCFHLKMIAVQDHKIDYTLLRD